MAVRSTTYRLVALTSFPLEEAPAEKTIASRLRVGRAHDEGIADLVFPAGRSGMSLQITSFDLDRIIVVLAVLELVQEPTMASIFCLSSAGRDFHLSTWPFELVQDTPGRAPLRLASPDCPSHLELAREAVALSILMPSMGVCVCVSQCSLTVFSGSFAVSSLPNVEKSLPLLNPSSL